MTSANSSCPIACVRIRRRSRNPLTPTRLPASRVFVYRPDDGDNRIPTALSAAVFSPARLPRRVSGVHETMQPAGAVAACAHTIHHSELIVVREGTLEFDHDGKAERAGPGSIIYVALGTLHAVRNVGDGPAQIRRHSDRRRHEEVDASRVIQSIPERFQFDEESTA